jgi:hypothetical protein
MPNEFGGEFTYSIFEIKQGQTTTAILCKKRICAQLNTYLWKLISYRLMKLKQFWPIQSKFLTSFSESHVSFQNKFIHLNFKFCLLHSPKLLGYAILGGMCGSANGWCGEIIYVLALKSQFNITVDQQHCSMFMLSINFLFFPNANVTRINKLKNISHS